MNYQDKTKGELISELQKLQLDYASLKTSYSKDVAEFKQADVAVAELQALRNAIFESTNDLIWAVDSKSFGLLSYNKRLSDYILQHTGVSLKPGMRPEEMFPTNDYITKWHEYYNRALNEGAFDTENRTPKGVKELLLNFHLLKKGDVIFGISVFAKDITERKLIEKALTQQNNALSMLNSFSIELSKLSFEDNLEALIAKRIKEITGAEAAVFAEYNYENRLLTFKHIEIEPGLLNNIVNLLGKQLNKIQSVVSKEMHREMTSEIIGIRRTLYEACFGAVSQPVATAIQALLKVDRFIGLAYLVEGKLYGTSLLAMSRDQPDPPKKILESLSFLAAVSLRRKRAEEALQKSEEKWRKLITTIPDFIALHDLEGRYVFLNHYAEGFSKEYVIGKSLYDFISEDSKEDFRRNYDECLNKKQIQRFSYSGFGNNKSLRIYDGYLVPILENDIIVNIMAIAMDITEHKRVESDLRESEAMFRSLFENSLVGISLARPGSGLFQVNNAYARMYGYENPGELLSLVHDTSVLFAIPEERKEVLRILQTEGFMEAREFELIRRDGSHFFVLVSACEIRDSDGNLLYNLATHIDLTERKKIEKEIRDASLYARKLIEASLDPLITISINGKITDVNRATEEITGINREKLIGTDFADYFTEPDKARKGYKTVFSKGMVKDYPLSILNKNGRKIDVLYNATLFINETGDVQGVFAAAMDITERKKMESDLRNSKKSLEKLNLHLNEVRENERAAISREIHDRLGQSLTALKIDLNWLSGKIDAESEEGIKLNEMIELVNATSMDIHWISSELRPAIFDDLGLASALEWYCEEFANRTGLKVQLEIEDIQTENINRDLSIYRVAQESLTNIIRHAGAKKVQIKLHKRKKDIVLLIEDDGIGISSDKIRSTKSFGLLGMFERVNQSGGHMEITAPDKGGTKVRVYMPIE